jgi:hemerythrin-like domain-containing protein
MKARDVSEAEVGRRGVFVALSAIALGGCAATGLEGPAAATEHEPEGGDHAEVTPGEDLMQEHGVLERVLLAYEEFAMRLEAGREVDPNLVTSSAKLVRRFVEEYHEKLEETFVFPRLERQAAVGDLVGVLKEQHKKGRALTDSILSMASAGMPEHREPMSQALRTFVRMYRPHASREDTILFPAFRKTFGAEAYREMGEQFEEREHAVLGEGGFDGAVKEIAAVETALGIHELTMFTPR